MNGYVWLRTRGADADDGAECRRQRFTGGDMPYVRITRNWPDGDRLTVEVGADSSYPDALSQARSEAHREFAEAVRICESGEA